MNFEKARFNMVEQQIRPWDVLDQRVLDVILNTPREHFVPADYRQLAFADIQIQLDHEQCMMHPNVEGRLLQALNIQETDSVLEVGTGSGYLTACLSKLAGSVDSIDIFPSFVATAGHLLESEGCRNVSLTVEDGSQSCKSSQTYQAIAITGALPAIPEYYKRALAIGGRMFIVVGQTNQPIMDARLVTRTSETQWLQESIFETHLPLLVNAALPDSFTF